MSYNELLLKDGGSGLESGDDRGGSRASWKDIDDNYFNIQYASYLTRAKPDDCPSTTITNISSKGEGWANGKFGSNYADASHFVDQSTFYPRFKFGEAYSGIHNEKGCQVNTMSTPGMVELITYEQKVTHEVSNWGSNTSAHGIPQIVRAENKCLRATWVIIYLSCVSNFMYQAVMLVHKFNRNEKIVDIELKFEAAPFPAITICNLNAYKATKAKDVDDITRMINAFSSAMQTAADDELPSSKRIKRTLIATHHHPHHPNYPSSPLSKPDVNFGWTNGQDVNESSWLPPLTDKNGRGRIKREEGGGAAEEGEAHTFEMTISVCECPEEGDCLALKEERPMGDNDPNLCYCAFDEITYDPWPCYHQDSWTEKKCQSCTETGICQPKEDGDLKCWCFEQAGGICVGWDGEPFIKLWEYFGAVEEEDTDFVEAMGFTGMTDEVAIVTRAKENMMFAMATLPMNVRQAMSYSKEEFVHKCSFNGKQCDIDKDFITLVDPTFGNCFTYNHNRTIDLMSIRAGPNYGLRLVLYVGDDDLPTTEANGVRLTVHDKDQFPFPDTFGYSAPTGTISSFGIRKKTVKRLPAPYGNCEPGGNMKNYIYKGYNYSGCFRSCFQMAVSAECNCGDPRFPTTPGNCLESRTKELGGMHGEFGCECPQPCQQSMYDVTYSAAVWPAPKLSVQPKNCTKTRKQCAVAYKLHGAMVEVFYEQLNYEMLVESSAYGWVNVLSDFGGQLGLWMGVSVITCFEFAFLLANFLFVTFSHQYRRYLEKKRKKAAGITGDD